MVQTKPLKSRYWSEAQFQRPAIRWILEPGVELFNSARFRPFRRIFKLGKIGTCCYNVPTPERSRFAPLTKEEKDEPPHTLLADQPLLRWDLAAPSGRLDVCSSPAARPHPQAVAFGLRAWLWYWNQRDRIRPSRTESICVGFLTGHVPDYPRKRQEKTSPRKCEAGRHALVSPPWACRSDYFGVGSD